MEIYAGLIDGIKKTLPSTISIEGYLKSLQPSVKSLRRSYASSTVRVNYSDKLIQSAYLITYFPHYYQLIYKILLEDCPQAFSKKPSAIINIIGGGPGTEAFGAIKFIRNNCPEVKSITINILDINAHTWEFSHQILLDPLIRSIIGDISLTWNAHQLDILSSEDLQRHKSHFEQGDLLIIQNCLNEIATSNFDILTENIINLFEYISSKSLLLLSDQTSGARNLIKHLEKELTSNCAPELIQSTLKRQFPTAMISVHHRPSELVVRNLLNYSDGLMPRKNIKYDYSIISKTAIQEVSTESLGLQAIYKPLNFSNLDANDYSHSKVFIGIDFGTSCTVISMAWLDEDQIRVKAISIYQFDHLGDKSKSPLVPSVLAYLEDYKRLIVGKHAAERKADLKFGKESWHSFKGNMIGLKLEIYDESLLKDHSVLKITNGQDALVLFFKYLKREIQVALTEEGFPLSPGYAFSVPAGFTSQEKQVFTDCLREANFDCEDVPFIDEPNAALINHLFEENASHNDNEKSIVLVLDIGAGTVDVSIMELTLDSGSLASKLLSTFRKGNIGSNLIDKLIYEAIQFKSTVDIHLGASGSKELIHQAEQLKIKICQSIQSDRADGYTLPAKAFSIESIHLPLGEGLASLGFDNWELTYREFSDIMNLYWHGNIQFNGLLDTITKSLKGASLKNREIDKVILSGGGGRNPYVKRFVSEYFDASEVIIPDNIQEQVSRGVALHSFVVNCFGKNIVTPILCHDVYILTTGNVLKIFKAGDAVPSDDFEIIIKDQFCTDTRYVKSYFSEERFNVKFFEIPKDTIVEKLIFFVDYDQDLKCDIVTDEMVFHSSEFFHVIESHFKTIN